MKSKNQFGIIYNCFRREMTRMRHCIKFDKLETRFDLFGSSSAECSDVIFKIKFDKDRYYVIYCNCNSIEDPNRSKRVCQIVL